VRVHCLALGGVELTSSTGKLTMNVINAVAEFESDLLVERTQAGLSQAKAEGKAPGSPRVSRRGKGGGKKSKGQSNCTIGAEEPWTSAAAVS
jgi:putative DNA-invertase from lambdoid prophage Rac